MDNFKYWLVIDCYGDFEPESSVQPRFNEYVQWEETIFKNTPYEDQHPNTKIDKLPKKL